MIIFRIRLSESDDIKTITKLQKINKNSKELLKSYINLKIGVVSDSYFNYPIKSIIISWGIREFKYLKTPFKNTLIDEPRKAISHTFYNYKLPISTKLSDYGQILLDTLYAKNIKVDNKTFLNVAIEKREDGLTYYLIDMIKNGKKSVSWEDKIIDSNTLIRTIGKTVLEYNNGGFNIVKQVKEVRKIDKIKLSKESKNKIITADIETYLDSNNKMVPYLAAFYCGKEFKYFFNKNPEILFNDFINSLFSRKYRNYSIYFHNFSGFDNFFLFKYLIKFGLQIKPIIHNGKFIQIEVRKGNKDKFTIKDSYLLLLQSLDKLTKNFNVDDKKTIFPYYLNNLDYSLKIGDYPDYKYFNSNKVNLNLYNEYKNKFILEKREWNFENEAINYCRKDVIGLYQVISNFSSLIFNHFKINIKTYPTIPSLSFGIYRSLFMPDKVIPMITSKIQRDIQSGYTGGSVDMFIPSFNIITKEKDKKIYSYDVNSLYPFVMKDNDYPVGNPTYFEGNIINADPNAFGFFYCKIIAPKDLKHPILQIHHKTKDGIRTVSPLGSFSGWFFSEELKNALSFGYKINLIKGYTFEKANIFSGYINDLYSLRLSYPKTDPMNYISKILLNSLYGRFGMKEINEDIFLIEKRELDNFILRDNIKEIIDFGKKLLLKIDVENVQDKIDEHNNIQNINISIAAAVTAYARIHMSQFKNNPNLPNLYYTDTDSLYFDGPIPQHFISPNELGLLKLEGIYDSAVFLAPKVYALKNSEEEIIKIKGLSKESIISNNITLGTLEKLLVEDSFEEISQNKWFRHLDKGNIEVINQVYTLKANGNKRKLVYNEDGILIGTYPYHINDGVL
jgi:hypothetical protein